MHLSTKIVCTSDWIEQQFLTNCAKTKDNLGAGCVTQRNSLIIGPITTHEFYVGTYFSSVYPPASKASREVENVIKRKNHPPTGYFWQRIFESTAHFDFQFVSD